MKRMLVVAGLAIAALFGGSIVILLILTREPSTLATPEPRLPPAPVAATPAAPPPVAVPRLAPDGERGGGTARAARRARAELSSAPMADRVTQKAVRKALHARSVESRLASCVSGWEFGGKPSVGGRTPRAAPAFLVLEVEARGGELRVVDAKVREWGGASEDQVACAATVLRSEVIPAPQGRTPDGGRTQMHFSLFPRRQAVAAR